MGLPIRASVRARLLRRYKRFLADVELPDGRRLTVHCPDPGSMHGCLREGAAVRCSVSADPARRLSHTLEMIRVGRAWVGVHTGRANAAVARALAGGALPELSGYTEHDHEVVAEPGSRLDFRLRGRAGDPRDAWLEVKSVSLAEGRTGLFPDSVSLRGRRHLEVLERLAQGGQRAALVFLVQRADCDRVAPADAIDPAWGRALRRAAARGVELFALGARVTARSIRIERRLPVSL